MRCLCPQHCAAIFQPVVQGLKVRKVRRSLPLTIACVADFLLNLALLHCRSDQWRDKTLSYPAAGLQNSGSKT